MHTRWQILTKANSVMESLRMILCHQKENQSQLKKKQEKKKRSSKVHAVTATQSAAALKQKQTKYKHCSTGLMESFPLPSEPYPSPWFSQYYYKLRLVCTAIDQRKQLAQISHAGTVLASLYQKAIEASVGRIAIMDSPLYTDSAHSTELSSRVYEVSGVLADEVYS